MTSTMEKFRSEKGYESISREFLQDTNISYQALGLLVEWQSLPETWEIHKTYIYNRRKENGRRSIDKVWRELVEKGYLVQFKKRVGKNYEYKYVFKLGKFTDEEYKDLVLKMSIEQFTLFYPSGVQNVQPKLDSTNCASNRTYTNKDSYKEIDYDKTPTQAQKKLSTDPESLDPFTQELVDSGLFSNDQALQVSTRINPSSFSQDMIDEQLEYMKGIHVSDPVVYFCNGMARKSAYKKAHPVNKAPRKMQNSKVIRKEKLPNWALEEQVDIVDKEKEKAIEERLKKYLEHKKREVKSMTSLKRC